MPNYYSITITEHFIEHNGHFDFHESHTGYVEEGKIPEPPPSSPRSAAPEGYSWIGIPRHFDLHGDHYHIEEAHRALAQEDTHPHH